MKSLAFAADGKSFFAAGNVGALAIYGWDEGQEEGRRVALPAAVARSNAVLSPDGREIASPEADGVWHIYDLKTGNEARRSQRLPGGLFSLTWSRDGRYLACPMAMRPSEPAAQAKFAICLTDAATGRVIRVFDTQSTSLGGAVCLSDDGSRAMVSTPAGALLWNRDPGVPDKPTPDKPSAVVARQLFAGHDGEVLSVAFSPDGKKILSGGKDGTVRLWDTATGQEIKKFSRPGGSVHLVGFAGKGTQAVAVTDERSHTSWDIDTEKVLLSVSTGKRSAWALAPDGEHVLFPQSDGFVLVHKTIDSGRRDHTFYNRAWGNTVAGAFSPEGNAVVFASSGDGLIHVGDLMTDKEVARLRGPVGVEIYCLAVAPKVAYVLTSDEKFVTLWSMQTLKAVRHFVGHKDRVNCVAFSPDGKHVVTGGADATVRVWDIQGKELARSEEHKGAVRGVAFSPDGKSVVSCGDRIKLWDWQPKPPAKP
jgi:WD40 repeat protein